MSLYSFHPRMNPWPLWSVYLPGSEITIALRMPSLDSALRFVEEQELDKQLLELEPTDEQLREEYDKGYEAGEEAGTDDDLVDALEQIRRIVDNA